jgi:hypothetical protein
MPDECQRSLLEICPVERIGVTEEETYHQLTELVREEVEELTRAGKPLPAPATRPMRDAVLA